ncbi:MAG: hypothetical protein J5494_02255 [Candidatus Methanomethylophilaceae archaeon]|nr:hypothetical protein [Candidatus Methanomethylophilaceae archaeon]
MSGFRTAAIAFLMLAIVFVPAVTDESDADSGTARMSDSYILSTDYKWISGTIIRSDCFYYKTSNTEAINAFEKCLNDREGTLPADDSGSLRAGEMVRIYYATKNIAVNVPITVKSDSEITDKSQFAGGIIMPYPAGFFVKAGDSFTIRITEAKDNYGEDVVCYVMENGIPYDLSETYSGSMKTTGEFTFETDPPSGADGRFYIDLKYESTGFSEPSGSAALYAAVCAVVTIAIFCILAYSGMKPKWSK